MAKQAYLLLDGVSSALKSILSVMQCKQDDIRYNCACAALLDCSVDKNAPHKWSAVVLVSAVTTKSVHCLNVL